MSKRKPSGKTKKKTARRPRVRGRAIDRLVAITQKDLEKMVQRQAVRDLLLEMGSEEDTDDGRTARRRIEIRLDRGMSSAGWKCFWYSFYLNFIKPIYGFKQIELVAAQLGDVVSIENGGKTSEDGDFTFNIARIDPQRSYQGKNYDSLHCEITPCNQKELKSFIDKLRKATLPKRVSLDGTLSFDPAHGGGEDTLEVHPVVQARFV